ncbi:uncharacterized protein [Parasteatoda tepidariorum]|uniref:uncharacterized protein n=1 Tax=Parasteatoda tepidariorum TaxID=114398 RepID=UPI001C71B0F7|nr:uncharacterized protein LOC122269120 [Parasteatoda tepidariorum]
MWTQRLIPLLIIICLGKGEDTCAENVVDVCGNPIQDLKFPKNNSEMESLCLKLRTFAECVINYKEVCPKADESSLRVAGQSLEFAHSLLKTSNTFCSKDSAWFKGVIKYGSCYDNFLGTREILEKCSADKVNKFHLFYSDQPNEWQCYYDITNTICVIDKISRMCGKMATEMALHFINGVGFWKTFCLNQTEEAMEKMENLEFTFEPETSKEEFVALFENVSDSYGINKAMCLSNYRALCQDPGDFFHDVLENSANLSAKCKEHIKYRECSIDYEKKCNEKIGGMSLPEDLETLNTFCNENSVLFQALADRMKCFNEFYQFYGRETENRIDKCRDDEIIFKDREKYVQVYSRPYPEDYGIEFCFYDLEYMKCLADVISEDCGETAKELMLQALKLNKMQYYTVCKHFPKKAELFMEELDFNLNPKYSLEDFISLLENGV